MKSQTGSCRAGEREVASVALRISTELFLCIIYVYAFTAASWGILVWGVAVAGYAKARYVLPLLPLGGD